MLSLCNTTIAEENFENLTNGNLVESKGFLCVLIFPCMLMR